MSVFKVVRDIVRRQFLSGVLIVVPLILTYVVLRFLFESVDGVLSPLAERILGYTIPGLGIAITILIIILAGFLTRNIIGATLYKHGDKLLARTPIIRVFYLAAKQLVEAVTIPDLKTFKEVVTIEYPRRGLYVIGFATSRIETTDIKEGPQRMVGVFVPSTPTPVSGFVVFVPEKEVIPLNISVEEAVKLLVSGGIVAPPSLKKVEWAANVETEA
jgi:uncharacterized membrane protein